MKSLATDHDSRNRIERNAQFRWFAIIFTILGLNIGLAIFAIFLAVGDPGLMVLERYKRDSFKFDEPIRVGDRPQVEIK